VARSGRPNRKACAERGNGVNFRVTRYPAIDARWLATTSNDLHCLQAQRIPWLLPAVLMPKWIKFCVALICVICVVAICIAPDLDLPDTVLRATQLGLLLLLATMVLASLCTGELLTSTSRPDVGLAPSEKAHFGWFLQEPERTCVFLC